MRYLITFKYDGTNYSGYQKQPNAVTIQGVLEEVLTRINSNKKVLVSASGRTDAHVHALGQRAHFDLDISIGIEELKRALNSLLPNDIYVTNVEMVDNNFHARFDVKQKKYIYKINIGEYNPLDRNYIYQYNSSLNIEKMKEAFQYLMGEHNFKTFTKTTAEIKDYIRTIHDIKLDLKDSIITIEFIGNGFLRYMVRNMVGTLIAVGEGKIDPRQIEEMLEKEDRREALKTASPEGLYLAEVYY